MADRTGSPRALLILESQKDQKYLDALEDLIEKKVLDIRVWRIGPDPPGCNKWFKITGELSF